MAISLPGCGSCSLLWPASFVLGIAVFAPLEALILCIDYYSESFPMSWVIAQLLVTGQPCMAPCMLTLHQLLLFACLQPQTSAAAGCEAGCDVFCGV
jgi:hypothetical protein